MHNMNGGVEINAIDGVETTNGVDDTEGAESMDGSIYDSDINNPNRHDRTIAIPTLEEALYQSEASASNPITHHHNHSIAFTAPSSSATNRNIQNLRLNTQPSAPITDPSLKSETSSIIPTSARLSIATTHQELRFSHHPSPTTTTNVAGGGEANGSGNAAEISSSSNRNGNVGAMLDGILANPGWNVATRGGAARRNSLFSMRSLAPTLPPYEDLRAPPLPLPQQADAEGVEGLRQGVAGSEADAKVPIEGGDDDDDDDDGGDAPHLHRGEVAGSSSPRLQSPPLPDPEAETQNALTAHYSHIVRTIDSRYTSELERLRQEITSLQRAHDEEMALMRNSIDAAYRVVLKKRNQEVEKAKESAASRTEELEREVLRWKGENQERVHRMEREREEERASVEEAHRRKVERERNAVEDLWERRWRERMDLVEEEAGARLRKRDREWLDFLEMGFPEACEEAKKSLVSTGEDDGG